MGKLSLQILQSNNINTRNYMYVYNTLNNLYK